MLARNSCTSGEKKVEMAQKAEFGVNFGSGRRVSASEEP